MYLTRTAGIETHCTAGYALDISNVSYPHCGNWNHKVGYLLESRCKCILPALRELKLRSRLRHVEMENNVSYPHCGNWNTRIKTDRETANNVSYPHCGNWNKLIWAIPMLFPANVSYPHCGNWNVVGSMLCSFFNECILPALRELKLRFQFPAFCVTNNVSYPHCGNWNYRGSGT